MARYAAMLIAGVFLIGFSRDASAQVDLSGIWAPIMHEDQLERAPGPEIGDYLGLPISDAGRMRGETWDASLLTLEEHTCKPHPATYGFRGVGNLRITTDYDPKTFDVIKIDTHIPHPPDFDSHTWQGFSTGRWDGPVLVVETSHLKAGWMRRNGLALSDRATMVERFFRHGDLLTHTMAITAA